MGENFIAKDIVGYQKNNIGNNLYNKPPKTKKRNGRGPLHLVKVVMYMMRGKDDKNGKKSSRLPSATNATLNNLVGSFDSFRPLHLQSGVGDMSPPAPTQPSPRPPTDPTNDSGVAKEAKVSPTEKSEMSPRRPHHLRSASSLSSSSSDGDLSRYASAQCLYDLDNHDDDDTIEEENDGDAYYDGIEGDEMIDAKAEMFIANFYQQMRLQQSV